MSILLVVVCPSNAYDGSGFGRDRIGGRHFRGGAMMGIVKPDEMPRMAKLADAINRDGEKGRCALPPARGDKRSGSWHAAPEDYLWISS